MKCIFCGKEKRIKEGWWEDWWEEEESRYYKCKKCKPPISNSRIGKLKLPSNLKKIEDLIRGKYVKD